jgi:hypothetical protein
VKLIKGGDEEEEKEDIREAELASRSIMRSETTGWVLCDVVWEYNAMRQ